MKNGKYCNGKKSLNMKPLAVLLALTLLVGCAIGGTIAWLTANTGAVENTFTVGDINITIAETDVDEDGSTLKNAYKIVPGGSADKDQTITVVKKSEDCYVYAYVENNVQLNNGTTVATLDINTTNWVKVGESDNKTVYRYKAVVAYNETQDQPLPVFSKVTYADTITKGNIAELTNDQIIVKGYAHQSANTSMAVADAAAIAAFGVTAVTTP